MEHRDEILDIFRSDAEEHFAILNSFLLEIDKDPENLELIDEVLRATHTLKGDSRMVGLAAVGSLTHKMEDILKGYKTGDVEPSEKNISLLFDATAALKKLVFEEGREAEPRSDLEEKLSKALKPRSSQRLKKKLTSLLGKDEVEKKISPPLEESSTKGEEESQEEEELEKEDQKQSPPEPTPEEDNEREEKEGQKSAAFLRSQDTLDMLRIRASTLDSILNLLGELTINREKITSLYYQLRNLLLPFMQDEEGPFSEDERKKIKEMLEDFYENTGEYYHLTTELQNRALEARMLPVSTIFSKYPMMVRTMARELDKKIDLQIQGEETQLDKHLLEAIRPALTHIIRNAVDHGLEKPEERKEAGKDERGTIYLRAYPKGNHVFLEIEDDGRGLDREKIRKKVLQKNIISEEELDTLSEENFLNLIFTPGFSTKEMITDISGRGIGMDVVANTVERLKGHVGIESREGEFTKITLQLPMTLSIMHALLVSCAGEIVAIPISFVQETQILFPSQIQQEGGSSVFNLRGSYVPLLHLSRILKYNSRQKKQSRYMVAILKFKGEFLGVIVDKFLREQELVIKGIGDFLDDLSLVSGATILRKGDPAIILNVYDVFQRLHYKQLQGEFIDTQASMAPPHILVVDDSITVRTVQKSVLEDAGFIVDTAASAEEALEMTDSRVYDLVVTDVQMGGMDGFELTESLRQDSRYEDIPIIIVTSLAKREDRQKGMEVGAQAYIVKSSYDQRNLLDTIRTLIGIPE